MVVHGRDFIFISQSDNATTRHAYTPRRHGPRHQLISPRSLSPHTLQSAFLTPRFYFLTSTPSLWCNLASEALIPCLDVSTIHSEPALVTSHLA
mmetsp:Transcript_41268/g.106758  ORF Transcript_41268/g.106758 Transcript_41268/m.106758 type:complete len:94 (-) Transcript_41268:1618-1899(-)